MVSYFSMKKKLMQGVVLSTFPLNISNIASVEISLSCYSNNLCE